MERCYVCDSEDVKHEQKEGKGIVPREIRKKNPHMKWRGIWNIYTCNRCGHIWRKLQNK